MSQSDFNLTFDYPVPVATLYAQFATAEGVRHWWTDNCELESRVGGHATFPFPDVDFHAEATIARLEPNRCVEWHVTECRHPARSGWVDLQDWKGTTIRFAVSAIDAGRSKLAFTHLGLAILECAESCSSLWQFYLNDSLRKYLEKGAGEPYRDGQPRDT